VYPYRLLVDTPGGFWLLGAIVLCTTGAEALYSDLGHVCKGNIRINWFFVKSSLLLVYFGQRAWLLTQQEQQFNGRNPFYAMMPAWLLPFGIGIATLTAVIASQALITGSFTLVTEAILVTFRLGFRVEQHISLYFRKVVEDLVRNKEVDIPSRYGSLSKQHVTGDFRFVVLERFLSPDNELPWQEKLVLQTYFYLKQFIASEVTYFRARYQLGKSREGAALAYAGSPHLLGADVAFTYVFCVGLRTRYVALRYLPPH
jgi:K+ transporter